MKCSNCAYDNPEDAIKCEKCGNTLVEITAKLDTMVEGRKKTDPLDFSPGEKFGSRYQVIEEIGRGGMGKVFKARDLELNIVVALKMIKPELSSDPDIISRFKRELLLAREILHENVIRIHDLGEIDNIRYISMNYIEGNSLKEIIQSTGKLTIEKSIDIAKQVCGALLVAHKKGIVHRDLKPQNIMIDKKGNSFVLDFGIARSIQSTGETEAGIVLGTPDFMSPEQIRGKKADAVSDIYSLGIIMYEMVTGELPFKADNPTALLYLHLNEEATLPSKLNPLIPKKLEKIILKCMEKKKKDRYQSIDKVLEDLELERTGQVRPIKEKKREKPEEETEEVPSGGKFFKYVFRIFLLLLIVYAAVSVLSLINDSKYKSEFDKIESIGEDRLERTFPVQKDWLPAEGETKDCNSWDSYSKLFPPKSDETGKDIPDDQYFKNEYVKNIEQSPYLKGFNKIVDNFDYNSSEDLQNIVDNYGNNFKFDELFAAGKCATLDPTQFIKNNRSLYLPIVSKYADMLTLKARADFLAGNTEAGLSKIHDFMVFSLDLLSSSTCLAEDRMAMNCFKKSCRELIPLLTSFELDLKSREPTPPLEEAGTAEAEEQDKALTEEQKTTQEEEQKTTPGEKQTTPPADDKKETAAVPEEEIQKEELQQEEGEDLISPLLARIKVLTEKTLEKLDPESIFEKEKLSLARNYENVYHTLELNKPAYHVYGKFKFWNYGFSIYNYSFKHGVQFYEDLFAQLELIDDPRKERKCIIDHFNKQITGDTIITAEIPAAAIEINTARMFAKIVLILLNINEYGLDSKEFSDLKATKVFTNECSGEPFQIEQDEGTFFIIFNKDFKLYLSITGYQEDHKQMLISLRDFTIQPEN